MQVLCNERIAFKVKEEELLLAQIIGHVTEIKSHNIVFTRTDRGCSMKKRWKKTLIKMEK